MQNLSLCSGLCPIASRASTTDGKSCYNIPLNELGQVGNKHIIFLSCQPGGDERLPAKVFDIQVDHASSAHSSWGGLRQVLHLKQYGDLHLQQPY